MSKDAEANDQRSFFDRFAESSSNLVSRAPFFVLTFLPVAVLQNSQRRAEHAMQKKLDALADGLADLMEHFLEERGDEQRTNLRSDVQDLKETVGLEKKT